MRTEEEIKTLLSARNYDKWRNDIKKLCEKSPECGISRYIEFSCGGHATFVLEKLGYETNNSSETEEEEELPFDIETYHPLDHIGTDYGPVIETDIPAILKELDTGRPIVFYHDYNDYMGKTYHSLPKSNRYGNHVFVIVRGGTKYFVSQAYMHRYKHSLIAYSRDEIAKMLKIIINDLSDYGRNKTWNDIDFDAYKKYFRTEYTAYPDIPFKLHSKVHGINLVKVFTHKIASKRTQEHKVKP